MISSLLGWLEKTIRSWLDAEGAFKEAGFESHTLSQVLEECGERALDYATQSLRTPLTSSPAMF